MSVNPTDSALNVRLRRLIATMAVVQVRGSRFPCRQADDPRARLLWRAAAKRYDLGALSRATEDTVLVHNARVPPERLGEIDTAALVPVILGWSGDYFRTHSTLIGRRGYADRVRGIVRPWYDVWEYEALESSMAGHFADTLFGALHRFAIVSSTGSGTTLRYCPTHDSQAEIDGLIHISPETTFTKVEWRFHTRESDEEAGGEVAFIPVEESAAPQPPLPITGFFYRRAVTDFYQVWFEHRHWRVCSSERLEDCRRRP